MPNIGLPEIIVVLIIALVIFGPKRLPELGRSMGKGLREFKGAVTGDKDDVDEKRQQLEATSAKEEPVEGEVVGEPKA